MVRWGLLCLLGVGCAAPAAHTGDDAPGAADTDPLDDTDVAAQDTDPRADTVPLCQGDPDGVVAWSLVDAFEESATPILEPRGSAWFEIDADCRFLVADFESAWAAWRGGTLTAEQAQDLAMRLELDRWPALTERDVAAEGLSTPDGATVTFTAGSHAVSCHDCTELGSRLSHVAVQIMEELHAAGTPVVPTTARVATFVARSVDAHALHVDWGAATPWTAWQDPDGATRNGTEAPTADLQWLLDVWGQQAARPDQRSMIAANVGTETVWLVVRPLP